MPCNDLTQPQGHKTKEGRLGAGSGVLRDKTNIVRGREIELWRACQHRLYLEPCTALPGPKVFFIFQLVALEQEWELYLLSLLSFSVITGKTISQSENLNDTWPQSDTGDSYSLQLSLRKQDKKNARRYTYRTWEL